MYVWRSVQSVPRSQKQTKAGALQLSYVPVHTNRYYDVCERLVKECAAWGQYKKQDKYAVAVYTGIRLFCTGNFTVLRGGRSSVVRAPGLVRRQPGSNCHGFAKTGT